MPLTIDGTDVREVTIDGTLVTEITVDGDEVWTHPPVKANLAHWYDATKISGSDGDAIGTWTDYEGTADATQSTSSKKPTLRTNEIGGNEALEFDGSDDRLLAGWSDVSSPYHFFIVAQYRGSTSISNDQVAIAGDEIDRNNFQADAGNNTFEIFNGSGLDGSSLDNSDHIWSLKFSGSDSVIRKDGTQTASGNAGTGSATGLSIGATNDDTDHGPWDFGEILFYNTELGSADRNDVESYLSDKWGITI